VKQVLNSNNQSLEPELGENEYIDEHGNVQKDDINLREDQKPVLEV